MDASVLSDVGLIRQENEDSYLVSPERGLFIVADGMGGHAGGQVASRMAISVIDREFVLPLAGEIALLRLEEALRKANSIIYQEGRNQELQGMGTTVTAAFFSGEYLYVAHIGDSRAYLLRDGKITLLTQDHSLVNVLLQNGSLTAEEAQNHPQRNILTRALGTHEEIIIDCITTPVRKGDYLLLCTDGLHNFIGDEEMEAVLTKTVPLHNKIRELVDLALQRGGADNITAILALYE